MIIKIHKFNNKNQNNLICIYYIPIYIPPILIINDLKHK